MAANEMEAPMRRRRFSGDSDELAMVVSPHVTSRSWLRCRDGKMDAGALDQEKVIRHAELINDLHTLQTNMSFKVR